MPTRTHRTVQPAEPDFTARDKYAYRHGLRLAGYLIAHPDATPFDYALAYAYADAERDTHPQSDPALD